MKRMGFDGHSCAGAAPARSANASPSNALYITLVFLEQPDRLLQRIAAERIAQLTRAHQLDDRRLALALPLARAAQRFADVGQLVDPDAFGAHRLRDRGEARVLEIHAEEAVRVEVDVVLFLRAPLLVVEDHGRDRNLLAHAGQDFAEAHAPGTVADIGDRGAVGRAYLAADHRGERVPAVAEHHRAEHAARP